jgi:hypothetical protein
MDERRLTILRNFLRDEVPADKYWQRGYGFFDEIKSHVVKACALGWATQCPSLQNEGLIGDCRGNMIWPEYQGDSSPCRVAQKFFCIDRSQFDHIFGTFANKDAEDKFETIRHIDEVLSGEI